MAKHYIDLSGRSGLAPKHQGDMSDSTGQPSRRYLGGAGQMSQGVYNPLRRYGYMSSTPNTFVNLTAQSASFNNLRAGIYDSNTQDYYLGDSVGNIWQGDDPTDLTLALIGPLGGTGPKIADFEIYQVNGVRKLFYVYTNNLGTNVGIANIPFASSDDDWLSTAPVNPISITTDRNPFLIPADNSYMYLIASNAVHKIDGTTGGGANGTITQNVLLFPPDFNLSDGFDWKGSIWLAVNSIDALIGNANTGSYEERVIGVYVWDRQSTQIRMQDFIPLKGVKELRSIFISPNGKIRAIVVSSERFVQLREFNGTTFEIIEELGLRAYPEFRESITKIGGLNIWLGADGYFYGYGKITPKDAEALYILGDTTAFSTGSFNTGSILLLDANQDDVVARSGIIWSTRTSTPTQSVKIWYPFGEGIIDLVSMTGNAGNVHTLVQMLPDLSRINYFRVYHLPSTTTGATVRGTLTWYYNQSTTAGGSVDITSDDIFTGFKYLPVGQSSVFSISFKITWDISTVLGAADWYPRLIEIDYSPTTKLK